MTTTMRVDEETMISLPGFTILVHEGEEGETGYWGEVIEMPGCISQGETLAELQANMQEAMEAILEHSVTSTQDAPSNFTISWPSTGTPSTGTDTHTSAL